MSYYRRSHVSVAARRAKAIREIAKLRKKGIEVCPVKTEGRKIAKTFWGQAWCDHLEKFSDYSNRLPRGKSYLRNGLVCHMEISEGSVEALVSGSQMYTVSVSIAPLRSKRWDAIKKHCMGQIGSVLELLQGRLSDNVMEIVTHAKTGLFPHPSEITLDCDCPDWSSLCKHLAATLYGVGAMLDSQPELLFKLRGVSHEEMISADIPISDSPGKRRRISGDAGEVFGIDLDSDEESGASKKTGEAKRRGKKRKMPEPARTEADGAGRGRQPVFKGIDVVKMRARLGLDRSQFARLIGTSSSSVRAWENSAGQLNLRKKSVRALKRAVGMKISQARKELGSA
ncbi:MAG: hypothetical protein OXC39_05975 [Candidatus Dadabacteria bacterium]|nr:hypothetical protein [Candidatus Dadabacteria bacterium]